MKKLVAALLYTALVFGANTAAADLSAAEALREGDMKKLVFHSAPQAISDQPFEREGGAGEGRLSDYQGKWVLLNFWATWCAPCRKEMPMLAELQAEFGGDRFEVVTLATGRNTPQGIVKFFSETGITNLPQHKDPKQKVAKEMAVFGLPITVIIDPDGNEVARLRGDADWASESAKAILKALIGAEG